QSASRTHLSCCLIHNKPSPKSYTLSLHDALPILLAPESSAVGTGAHALAAVRAGEHGAGDQLDGGHAGRGRAHELGGHGLVAARSEEHTSELQSRENLVCRLLLEKKKRTIWARR